MTTPTGPEAPRIPITRDRASSPAAPSRPDPTFVHPRLGLSDDGHATTSTLRSIVIGWVVIAVVIALPVVGYVVAGDRGALVALLGYIALMVIAMMTMLASVLGDIVMEWLHDRRDAGG
jgi:hypothetical protein